jgi:drug/metabolite transporter (DMT)-like permease
LDRIGHIVPPATPTNPGGLNLFLVLFVSVIWGAAFLSVRISLDGYGPVTVAALRTLVAFLVLLAISVPLGQGLSTVPGRAGWFAATTIGIVSLAVPFSLLSWGQQFAPSAFAGVAMGAVPLLILPLVAIFSPEEGIGPRRIFGLVLGFIGLLVLIGPAAIEAHDTSWQSLWGQIAFFGAALCYAAGSVMMRRAPAMPPLALATSTLGVAAAILVPLALLIEGIPQAWPFRPTTALLYAALFPTALAAVIRVHVIRTAGSLFMSIAGYLVPVWAVIFGIAFLNEDLPGRLFLSLTLILLGIAISQSRAIQDLFRKKARTPL